MRYFLLVLLLATSAWAEEEDSVNAATSVLEGVAQGSVTKHRLTESRHFPGTERDYWLYVPAAYSSSEPACLMVFQDGGSYVNGSQTPRVLDSLIAAGEIPLTVALFIDPGVVPPLEKGQAGRANRSVEYDGMGRRYADFLVEEMLPRLAEHHDIIISDDPDDRGICGASSGAIAAFTAAWERPDVFRRVLSQIGSYVDLRGGGAYIDLIRRTEPKPLRIFLQDGEADQSIYAGDWWAANQAMAESLEWAGYEVAHEWGEGGHTRKHGNAIFPHAMRWLWKDHGEVRVSSHPERSQSRAMNYLVPDESWELVSEGHKWAEGLAVSAEGSLYFTDVPKSELWKITPDGEKSLVSSDTGGANGIALGEEGKILYTTSGAAKEIRAYELDSGAYELVDSGRKSNDIVATHAGHLYFTEPGEKKVWHIDLSQGGDPVGYDFPGSPNGIGASADQSQIYVCDFSGRAIHSYMVQADGSLAHRQAYFHALVPESQPEGRLDGMTSARTGQLLVGTELGVQIFDPMGRAHIVLPRPVQDTLRVNYAHLRGTTLYIATGREVWKREIALTGAPAWELPMTGLKARF